MDNQQVSAKDSQANQQEEKASSFGKHPLDNKSETNGAPPLAPPPFDLGGDGSNPYQLQTNGNAGWGKKIFVKRYALKQIALHPKVLGNCRLCENDAGLFGDTINPSSVAAGTSPGVNYVGSLVNPGNVQVGNDILSSSKDPEIVTNTFNNVDPLSLGNQISSLEPAEPGNESGVVTIDIANNLEGDNSNETVIAENVLNVPDLNELFPGLQNSLLLLSALNESSFSEGALTGYRNEFTAMAPNPGLEGFAHAELDGIGEIWNQTFPIIDHVLGAFGSQSGEVPPTTGEPSVEQSEEPTMEPAEVTILASNIYNNLLPLFYHLNTLHTTAVELALIEQQAGESGDGVIAEADGSLLLQLSTDRTSMETLASALRPHSSPDVLVDLDPAAATSKTQFVVSLLTEFAIKVDIARQVYDHLVELGLDPNAERDRIIYSDGTYVNGTDGDDILIGNDLDNVITGNGGDDILFGAGGKDVLLGDGGNDILFGMDGNDTIDPGAEGNNTIYGGNGNDNIFAGGGNDIIYGEGGVDYIYAGEGQDEIYGGDGDDFIYGQGGNDTIDGGDGHDFLDGGFGTDTLEGGLGENAYKAGELGDSEDEHSWELALDQLHQMNRGVPRTQKIAVWRQTVDQGLPHQYGNSLANFLLDDLASQYENVINLRAEVIDTAMAELPSPIIIPFPFNQKNTSEGTAYARLVALLETSRRTMMQLKIAVDDYIDDDPGLVAAHATLDEDIDKRIGINHEKLGLLDPFQILGYDPDATAGEHRHRELAGSFRISENPNSIQMTVGVELRFNVTNTLSGEEFKQKVLFNLFGPGEHEGYTNWTPDKSTYTPEDSPVSVWVNSEDLVNKRLDIGRDGNIPIDEPNETIEGEQERFDEFFGSEDQVWKDAISAEAGARWLRMTNRDANGADGVDSFGDIALYSQILDEILYQQEVLNNLPTDVFNFLDQVTESLPIVPADFEQLIRIVNILEPLSAIVLANFLDTHGAAFTTLDDLESLINEFIDQTFEDHIIEVENEENILKLSGLGDLYTLYLELRREQLNLEDFEGDPDLAQQAQLIRLRILELEGEIDLELIEVGVADIDEFAQFISDFEISFEQQAAVMTKGILSRAQTTIEGERQRYGDLSVVEQLTDDAFLVMRGDSEYESLSEKYPVFYDEKFPDRLKVDLGKVSNGTPEEVQSHLIDILGQREAGMSTVEGYLTDDSGYIYKLKSQHDQFFAEQGIESGSIQHRIIDNKIYRDQLEEIAFGVGIGLISMGLAALTGGGSLVATGALVATLGLDGYFIYQDYQNYVEEEAIAGAGWGDDPSVAWLGLSVLGAVVDLAHASRLIVALKPSAKILYETGEIKPFLDALATVESSSGHRMLAPGSASRGVGALLSSLAGNVRTWHDTGEELRAVIQAVPEGRNVLKSKPVSERLSLLAVNQLHSPEPDFGEYFNKVKGIMAAEKPGYTLTNGDFGILKKTWSKSRRGNELFKLPDTRPSDLGEIATDLITRVKARIAENSVQFKYFYEGNDDRVKEFVAKGLASDVSLREIEDLLYIGSRRNKPIVLGELWNQVDYFGYIKTRKFPAKFKTKEEFEQFATAVRSRLQTTTPLSNYGLDSEEIRIIGSAVRKSNPGDIDIDILVSSNTYYQAIKDGFGSSISRIGGSGTQGPINFANLNPEQINILGLEVTQNGNHFEGPVRSFRQVILNKRISTAFLGGGESHHLIDYLNLGVFRNAILNQFPDLKDISFTIKNLDNPDFLRTPFMSVPTGAGGGGLDL